MMPTLDDLQAATPRCPRLLGNPPANRRVCNQPLTSRFELMEWACSKHGDVLSWEAAGRRVRQMSGGFFYESEAA